VRAAGGCVSGSQRAVVATSSSENTTRNQKISGQSPPPSRIQPPMMGAMAGAMPKIIDTWLISRCASGPW